jgi:hypothetical protein
MNGVTKPTPAIETRRCRTERFRRWAALGDPPAGGAADARGDEVMDDTMLVPQRTMFT